MKRTLLACLLALLFAFAFTLTAAQAGCITVQSETVCGSDIPDNPQPICPDITTCDTGGGGEPTAPPESPSGDDPPVSTSPDTKSQPDKKDKKAATDKPSPAKKKKRKHHAAPSPAPQGQHKKKHHHHQDSPAQDPGPPYEPMLAYCAAAKNTTPSGVPIPIGTFLWLRENQPLTDPHYKGASYASFVEGVGLTCAAPPKGYKQQGTAGDDQHVARGVYPYYVSGKV